MRLLVTGSRDFGDGAYVRGVLMSVQRFRIFLAPHCDWTDGENITLVHGAATGLDTLAATAAKMLLWEIEEHPAKWDVHGKKAGPLRNTQMVNLGADLCLGFPIGLSRGTRDCMRKAGAAGIPTFNMTEKHPNDPNFLLPGVRPE